MTSLENEWLQFTADTAAGAWSLLTQQDESISLQNVRMQANYRRGPSRFNALQVWHSPAVNTTEDLSTPHGKLNILEITCLPDANGLQATLLFALPESFPFLLWKTRLVNRSDEAVLIDRLEMLGIEPQNGGSMFTKPLHSPAFFSNGWQSWSYCGVYGAEDRFHHTRLGPLRAPTDVNAGTPQPSRPGHFSSDMFGVLGDTILRSAVLAGFLSQQQHFGSLEARISSSQPRLNMWANGDGARLDPGASMETDWAYLQAIQIDQPDPLETYFQATARQHNLQDLVSLRAAPPSGWCSWYQFSSEQYTGTITYNALESNMEALLRLEPNLPLKVFQIDDGFQAQIGDWLSFAADFPNGVAPLAEKAASSNLTPGLWLAPFVVHPKSRLAAEHPDWILHGRFGRPVNAGLSWMTFATALDITHPDALSYASEVVHKAVVDWGFAYLKLDYLYAASLPGKFHDPTRTRAQVLHSGLKTLRQAAGKGAYLLGCGCPLGPAIGLVDGMRIGPDTHWTWYPKIQGLESFFRQEPNLPSAYNACRNAITRAAMHRHWWINDPDCLLLRDQTSLTESEVRTVATVIALTGGTLMLSDDLPGLSKERLRIAEVLLPLIGQAPQVLEWFDLDCPSRLRLDLENKTGSWHLLAFINWRDDPQDITINLREFGLDQSANYYASEFWSQRIHRMTPGKLLRDRLPAHGTLLLAVRPLVQNEPQYLGSDLHISQGLEAVNWKKSPRRIELKLEHPGSMQGSVTLSLSKAPKKALLDGQDCAWQPVQEGIYKFPVEIQRTATLRLHR